MKYNISVKEGVALPQGGVEGVIIAIFEVEAKNGTEACKKLLKSKQFKSLSGNVTIHNIYTDCPRVILDE